MSENEAVLRILDADPPSRRWILSTGDEFIQFDELEGAISHGLGIAQTVLVRVDGSFFWMGRWTTEVTMYGDDVTEGPSSQSASVQGGAL